MGAAGPGAKLGRFVTRLEGRCARQSRAVTRLAPSPPPGHIPAMLRPDWHTQMVDWADEYGPFFRVHAGLPFVSGEKGGHFDVCPPCRRPLRACQRSGASPPTRPALRRLQVVVSDPAAALAVYGRGEGSVLDRGLAHAVTDLVSRRAQRAPRIAGSLGQQCTMLFHTPPSPPPPPPIAHTNTHR